MKKLLVLLLAFSLIFAMTGCSAKPADQMLKDSFVSMAKIKSLESLTTANITINSPSYSDVPMEFVFTMNSKAIDEKIDMTVKGEYNGVSVEGRLWGSSDKLFVDVPVMETVFYIDTNELNEELGIDLNSEETETKRKAVTKSIGEFFVKEINLTDFMTFTEPVKETITINNKELKATKIESKLKAENSKKIMLQILNFVKTDEAFMDYALSTNPDLTKDLLIEEIQTTIDELESLSDEDFNMVLDEVNPILENLNIDFYLYKGNIVKYVIDFKYTDGEDSIDMNISQEMFNIDEVADFPIDEPMDAIPFQDFVTNMMYGY